MIQDSHSSKNPCFDAKMKSNLKAGSRGFYEKYYAPMER
jgi:hypothetical protein